MITPSIGLALWARRGLWPPRADGSPGGSRPQPAAVVLDTLTRIFGRIQGYEHLGLDDEVCREIEALPPAVRELPSIQMRLGGALERLAHFGDALALYDRMKRSTLSQLGRVRCLAQLHRGTEARALLAHIRFDASAVKEFVQARDLVR